MMGPAGMMDWENFNESFPAYLTIAVMPLTYSIANGVVAGLLCYLAIDCFSGRWWAAIAARLFRGREDAGLDRPLVGAGKRRASVTASPHAVCRPSTPVHMPGALGAEQGRADRTAFEIRSDRQ